MEIVRRARVGARYIGRACSCVLDYILIVESNEMMAEENFIVRSFSRVRRSTIE